MQIAYDVARNDSKSQTKRFLLRFPPKDHELSNAICSKESVDSEIDMTVAPIKSNLETGGDGGSTCPTLLVQRVAWIVSIVETGERAVGAARRAKPAKKGYAQL